LAVTFVVRFASLAWLFLAVYLFCWSSFERCGKCEGVTGSLVLFLGDTEVAWNPDQGSGFQKREREIGIRMGSPSGYRKYRREARFKRFSGRILRFVAHDELMDG